MTAAREPASAAALTQSAAAAKPAPAKRGNDARKTEIFRDAGLGLFIHWGINSQMGTEISWPLYHASDDYIEKYYALAKTFNPAEFDPAEWARLAKLAGMEYVVFTAKHHDGYCMYDTAYSDFKITNGPYGKDIALMVAEAFRKEGILAGFYYSPGDFRYQYLTGLRERELYEPNFAAAALFGPRQKSFIDYERGQVEELLTRYGDIFQLWFDGKCEPLKEKAWQVKPDVFIGRGEIPTPEQAIPGKSQDEAWESCLTTSVQWSYSPYPDIRTPAEVVEQPDPHPGARRQHAPQHRAAPRRPDRAARRGPAAPARAVDDALRRGRPRRPALDGDQRRRCLAHPQPDRRRGLCLRRPRPRPDGARRSMPASVSLSSPSRRHRRRK